MATISDEDEEFRAEQEAWQQAGAEAFWRVEGMIDEEQAETWMQRIGVDEIVTIKGEVLKVVAIACRPGRREITLRLLSLDCVEGELERAQVSDEMTEDGLTGRALELADLVSDMIWGGDRGWERANNVQFKHLKREARKRMKSGSVRLAEEVENENRYCSGCGDSHKGRRCYD